MLTSLPLWLQDGGLLLPVPPGVQRPQTDRAHVPEELGRADLQRASPASVPGLQVSESRVGPTRSAEAVRTLLARGRTFYWYNNRLENAQGIKVHLDGCSLTEHG